MNSVKLAAEEKRLAASFIFIYLNSERRRIMKTKAAMTFKIIAAFVADFMKWELLSVRLSLNSRC